MVNMFYLNETFCFGWTNQNNMFSQNDQFLKSQFGHLMLIKMLN